MKKKKILAVFIIILSLFLVSCNVFNTAKQPSKVETEDESIIKEPQEIGESEYLAEENTIKTATICAAGDIMFHSPQIKAAYSANTDSYDFTENFKYVKKYISEADLAIGNLETVTAGSNFGYQGYPNFNAPDEIICALKYSGFDVLSTANNHCLDQRRTGVINTIDRIYDNGLENIGTYKEKHDLPFIKEVNGIKIALLSYTYGCNGMEHSLTEEELGYMVNFIDEGKIKNDIQKARELDADAVVVVIHWGNEYQLEVSEEQLELGKKIIDWGADIILGSHPHVVQKSEIVNHDGDDKFIIYSMGNFLSNQRAETVSNKYTEDGVIVNIQLEKDFSNNKTIIKDVSYVPTWVRKYYCEGKLKYEIMPILDFVDNKNVNGIDDDTMVRMKESYSDTIEKMAYINKM